MAVYNEVSIPSSGTEIVLSLWEADHAEGVIVFMPATMVHPLFYKDLLHCFAAEGFHVVGVHPVGHGKSPRNKDRFTINDLVQNGKDAVGFALERYGLPVIAMGSSQGGVVTAALASEEPRIAAAFPHNMMLAELPDSITISRFPKWLRHIYKPVQGFFKFCGKIIPDLKLPLGFYLERKRISRNPSLWEKVASDPLCLSLYPLCFLSSLFTTVFPGITDGSILCPVYVIADSGDALFTREYTYKVFDELKAPWKELVEFHFNDHMLMVNHPREVSRRVAGKMREALKAKCIRDKK